MDAKHRVISMLGTKSAFRRNALQTHNLKSCLGDERFLRTASRALG